MILRPREVDHKLHYMLTVKGTLAERSAQADAHIRRNRETIFPLSISDEEYEKEARARWDRTRRQRNERLGANR